MPSPLELLRTSLADHYRIERELGAGGIAIVHLAALVREMGDTTCPVDPHGPIAPRE